VILNATEIREKELAIIEKPGIYFTETITNQ